MRSTDVREGHDLLLHAVGTITSLSAERHELVRAIPLTQPNRIRRTLQDLLPGRQVVLTGTLERRLLGVSTGDDETWLLADLSGQSHATRCWPHWAQRDIHLHSPHQWISRADVTPDAVTRLTRPRITLAALYRPEYFPLPRFPLGISDLARAARATLSGEVELRDMQLGATLDDLITEICDQPPDILGISATFGQHDLMLRLLDAIESDVPLVIAGGSLTVRNEGLLLERYPRLLIARGAGEPTIAELIAHWHGDLELDQIHGIGYRGRARGTGALDIARRTPVIANREAEDFFPELDLLQQTFAHKGVAQLETSRGCTNYCSFCPRGHKGTWAGTVPDRLPWLLADLSAEFDRWPDLSRTLYLVDEEFIGRDTGAVPRALAIATTLADAGFAWETSCRIDQVVRQDRDRSWHLQRGHLWRTFVNLGLRRCLFGVESGVTSILERFNKETTAEQNALAIRTLSALGVPTRFTYITFDHLMSLHELHATHAFQARTDLLLRPLPHLDVDQIIDGVRDADFVARHSLGRPFYTAVSYMLVSMECLIGAAYTRAVQNAGLAGAVRPSMGRIDADFADWRIGACSEHAQLWIDRTFALDYTLKSLEKILDGTPRAYVRDVRGTIKDAAFAVFTQMIDLIDHFPEAPDDSKHARLAAELTSVLDVQLNELHAGMTSAVRRVSAELPLDAAALLEREHRRWEAAADWQLINTADPCGS
jgi:hypothetical protein